MKTVLGLSVTARGIAWALVEGDRRSADVTPLDDDAFEVEATEQLAARAAAAARSAKAIAASSGQDVAAIGVSWPEGAAVDGGHHLTHLLDQLAAAGFDDVRVFSASPVEGTAEDPGRTDSAGPEGVDARVRDARAAAHAVATNAVASAPRPSRRRPPTPCRHRPARALAAAAVTVAAGLLTVGSQFAEPTPLPAAHDGDITVAAAPRLVTVATSRPAARSVTVPTAEEPVSMQAAETVEPQVVPLAQVATPVSPTTPATPQAFADSQPVVAVVPHLPSAQPRPSAAEPHLPAAQMALPAAQPHIAVDPSPGPALQAAQPGPAVPAAKPDPAPVPGLWFLGAMP